MIEKMLENFSSVDNTVIVSVIFGIAELAILYFCSFVNFKLKFVNKTSYVEIYKKI